MMENLPFGLKPEDLITVMAAVSAFLMVLAVWNSGLVRDPMRGRLQALKTRRDALKAGYISARKRAPVKRTKSVGFMREILTRVNVVKEEQSRKFSRQLAAAGIRSKDGLVILTFFKLILPIIVGLTALIVIYGLELFDWQATTKLLGFVGSMLLASMAPDICLKNMVQKRQHAIRKGLPDALDLLVICAEAGLTLDAALQRVARENERGCPELADELSLTSIELGFLPDRRQALNNLATRIELPAIKAVVATLSQAEKYGTPLAQSLRVLSAEFRNERMMRAEEKAARLPAIMTIPLIIFIMPTLFVVLMGPAACSISDNLMK